VSTVDSMTCMSCGRTKAYPDGFPDRAFAECWECAWADHIRKAHPKIVKRIRKDVRKRAHGRAERELLAAAFDNEKRILLGPDLAHARAQALRDAAETARGMHDPPEPECAEWADWLDARADREVAQ
jgi:hypothetical protein